MDTIQTTVFAQSIVETKFLELAMSLLDFSSRIPLGTFSILLSSWYINNMCVFIPSQQHWRGYSNAADRGCLSEWVGSCVRWSVLLYLVDTIATTVFAQSLSNFICKLCMMRGGTYWFGVTGSNVKVNFGTLYIRPCGHNTDYSFCPITFKLHM